MIKEMAVFLPLQHSLSFFPAALHVSYLSKTSPPHSRIIPPPASRLDGTMTVPARERSIGDFEEKPEVIVLLVSLKVRTMESAES